MKKLISLAVSTAILLLLYQFLDRDVLFQTLSKTDLKVLAWSLLLLVTLVFLSGLRLQLLGQRTGFHISARKAVEATFVANALNMFLPGKLGDILKSSVLAEEHPERLRFTVLLAAWEKIADLTMLFLLASLSFLYALDYQGLLLLLLLTLFCCLLLFRGVLLRRLFIRFAPAMLKENRLIGESMDDWCELQSMLASRGSSLLLLLGLTLLVWFGHIVQICLMISALGVTANGDLWAVIIGNIPIAIVAGLIPLTFAGVGTRDAALVLLLGALIGTEVAAALGVLFWLRYLVPGLLGVPLLPRFFRTAVAHSKRVVRNRSGFNVE